MIKYANKVRAYKAAHPNAKTDNSARTNINRLIENDMVSNSNRLHLSAKKSSCKCIKEPVSHLSKYPDVFRPLLECTE